MRRYSAEKILKMPRLSHLLYDAHDNFHPERLITDLGLYEGVLIDAEEIDCEFDKQSTPYSVGGDVYVESYIKLTNANVSHDVEALHKFLLFTENIMLPCAECKQNQPFSPKIAFNPRQLDYLISTDKDGNDVYNTIILPIDQEKHPKNAPSRNNVFDHLDILYCSGKNEMSLFGNQKVECEDIDTSQAALSCVDGISEYFSEIRRDFVCSLNNDHHVTAYFIIHKAIDVCKEQKLSADYEKLKYCLVLEKVGQEPSMADLQMFDIEKYKKVLSSDSFRDFSMALGLHASGVGCGSLLYLRRIYETLIKNAQDKCSKLPEWNEEEYNKRRFNEKIEYLESLGEKIIPDDLSDVKDKIYGWLSKGVHELSEQASKELFPSLKYSIELILDEQIAQKEKEDKLKELKKTLNK